MICTNLACLVQASSQFQSIPCKSILYHRLHYKVQTNQSWDHVQPSFIPESSSFLRRSLSSCSDLTWTPISVLNFWIFALGRGPSVRIIVNDHEYSNSSLPVLLQISSRKVWQLTLILDSAICLNSSARDANSVLDKSWSWFSFNRPRATLKRILDPS